MGASEDAVRGLHHVTAITGHAAQNVSFYTRVLGMRLVKKTVNQDDVRAYHLFYGDETGGPGTELTFFDWPDSPQNVAGIGSIGRISLSVPDAAALQWWRRRFDDLGVEHGEIGPAGLPFADPEGQTLALVDGAGSASLAGRPWAGSPVPAEVAVRGLSEVTLHVAALAPTRAVFTRLLGFRPALEGDREVVLETGAGGAGARVRLAVPDRLQRGRPGIGGVHHVAFRTADDETQRSWHGRLRLAGVPSSPIVDRYYFRSVYFREPGGVLLEIATDGPGFATDEPVEHLGERLSLPPFLEGRRAEIEASLVPLETGADMRG